MVEFAWDNKNYGNYLYFVRVERQSTWVAPYQIYFVWIYLHRLFRMAVHVYMPSVKTKSRLSSGSCEFRPNYSHIMTADNTQRIVTYSENLCSLWCTHKLKPFTEKYIIIRFIWSGPLYQPSIIQYHLTNAKDMKKKKLFINQVFCLKINRKNKHVSHLKQG